MKAPEFLGSQLVRDAQGVIQLHQSSLSTLGHQFGTPLYIYDFEQIRQKANRLSESIKKVSKTSRGFFAVKALSHRQVLRIMNNNGLGVDVVSAGELLRSYEAGIPAGDIIYSGVGKTDEDIRLGCEKRIGCFNIESPHELLKLQRAAKEYGRIIHVAIRLNPDVDGKTHEKINTGHHDSKFGLEEREAFKIAQAIMMIPELKLVGVSCHIGSQLFDFGSIASAAKGINEFARALMAIGAPIGHVDMGGGLGVPYTDAQWGQNRTFDQWVEVAKTARPNDDIDLYLEPGRCLVAESGTLLTKVIDIKMGDHKNFLIVDAGMTELIRPALYNATHKCVQVVDNSDVKARIIYDVVGPVCENSCFLANDVELPPQAIGDFIAVLTTGAYGLSMASNYNSRPLPAEIAVDQKQSRLIRPRQSIGDLWATET